MPESQLLRSLRARRTRSSKARALGTYGRKQGIIPGELKQLDFSQGTARQQGLSEIEGEVGQTHRQQRIEKLLSSLENRTTGSSRKRAFNRAAANLGYTGGLTGTKARRRK